MNKANAIVILAIGLVSLAGWLAERRVKQVPTPLGIRPVGKMTCKELYAGAYPADSARHEALLKAVCGKYRDSFVLKVEK